MCHKIAKAEVDEVMYLKAREGETPVGLCEWISQPANHSGCSSQSDNLLCHNRTCVDGGPVSNLLCWLNWDHFHCVHSNVRRSGQ